MNEYSIFKASNSKEGSLTVFGGSIEVRNEFGNFPADDESIKHDKTPPLFIPDDFYLRRGILYWIL